MNKIYIIILLLIFSGSTFGQSVWTLEDCINYAHTNNIDIKKKELAVKMSEVAEKQSKLERLPSLSGRSSYSLNFGRNISYSDNSYVDENTQTTDFSLTTGMVLFNGFKLSNSIQKNKLELLADIKNLEVGKATIAVQISGAYLQILYNIEILQIAKEQYDITKEQYDKTSKLVDAGKFPKGELLKQKAMMAQEEASVIEAQNALELAYLDMCNLLNMEYRKDFKIKIPDNIIVNANISLTSAQSCYDKALEIRPEIELANLRLKSTEKGVEIAKADRYPTLSIGGGWSAYYADNILDRTTGKTINFSDQLSNTERKYVGLQLDIPIFRGWQVSGNIKRSRLEKQNAELELENTKNILRREVQTAYSKALAAMKKYYANEIAVESGKEAFRYSEEKYNLGMTDIVSYKEAKKEFVISKSKYLQAKYDYILRTKILDFYCGIPIRL